MNRLSPLSMPADGLVVTGGRVPLAWQRAMRAREAWLKEWPAMCSWIQSLTSLPLRLRDGLLLGPYLAALTGGNDVGQASEPGEEAAENRAKPWAWSGANGILSPPAGKERNSSAPDKRERFKAWANARGNANAPAGQARTEQAAAQRLPRVRQLAPQAGRHLLRKLAGDAALAASAGRAQGRRAMVNRPQHKVARPAPGDAATHQEWLQGLARRSADALHSVSAPVPDQDAQWPREVTQSDPWATPVTGRMASRATLAHLAGVQASSRRGANRRQQAAEGSSYTEGASADATGNGGQRATSSSASSGARWLGRAEAAGANGRGSERRAADVEPVDFAPGANHLQPDDDGAPPRQHSPVQPPTVAPSLPTLRTPSSSREPAFPLASSMIRQEGVQQREAGDEDELIELSERVRRILTEEARRFGIDV